VLTILIIATVLPLFDIPKAKPKKTIIGIKYAKNPNIPNKTLLIAVVAVPLVIPVTHRNEKIQTAKITISITSFLTATSTVFLELFFVDFLVLELELDALFLEPELELLVDLAVFPDACDIITSPN
jgi:hypothetical protein